MNRALLGFDIRLCAEDYVREDWDQKRRSVFLLNPELKWPISIDENVWPPFFEFGERDSQTYQTGFWRNLQDLRSCFLKQKKRWQRAIVIGVVLISKHNLRKDKWWWPLLRRGLSMELLPEHWAFLGYDVADSLRISGLSNCGWVDPLETDFAKKEWCPRLNEFGLFEKLDDAMAFRDEMDRRVLSHAPFYVYGLYRDPEILHQTEGDEQ
jgi:hypothetical protein